MTGIFFHLLNLVSVVVWALDWPSCLRRGAADEIEERDEKVLGQNCDIFAIPEDKEASGLESLGTLARRSMFCSVVLCCILFCSILFGYINIYLDDRIYYYDTSNIQAGNFLRFNLREDPQTSNPHIPTPDVKDHSAAANSTTPVQRNAQNLCNPRRTVFDYHQTPFILAYLYCSTMMMSTSFLPPWPCKDSNEEEEEVEDKARETVPLGRKHRVAAFEGWGLKRFVAVYIPSAVSYSCHYHNDY